MSRTAGHAKVIDALSQTMPRDVARPRLLDIPSGEGPVQRSARELGYDVVGLDLFPSAGLRGVQGNACEPLPFLDDSFDVVMSMEGIEHFENQTDFVRQCARVLKPGGKLVLTTPNTLHLSARATALLTANRSLRHGLINEVSTFRGGEGKRLYHGHAYLIDVFRLRYILRIVGLELVDVRGTTLSPSSVLMAPLELLIRLATPLSIRLAHRTREKRGQTPPDAQLEQELQRVACSRALLYRKKLIVIARKPLRTSEAD